MLAQLHNYPGEATAGIKKLKYLVVSFVDIVVVSSSYLRRRHLVVASSHRHRRSLARRRLIKLFQKMNAPPVRTFHTLKRDLQE